MNIKIVLCAYIVSVRASSNDTKSFRKCCPQDKILIKESTSNTISTKKYSCIDSDRLMKEEDNYIVVSDPSEYGMPDGCDIEEVLLDDKYFDLPADRKVCYDVLMTELNNGSVNTYKQKTVGLTCNGTEFNTENNLSENSSILKCCPFGQSYDAEFHLCRVDLKGEIEESWIQMQLNASSAHVFTQDNALCLTTEYDVELKEGDFTFALNDNELWIRNENDGSENVMPNDFWCVDQEYNTRKLVARVCTENCSTFGALCIKKCCGIGEYFERCGTETNYCKSSSTILFNSTSYTEPLTRELSYNGVLGIRSDLLQCPNGSTEYILSGEETEVNALSKNGWLNYFSTSSNDYCLESIDTCSDKIVVKALICRLKNDATDTLVKFVLVSISATCLALTLVVYCVNPTLHNLHGLTLICHVSTMLLAYSCLARVHYDYVESRVLCIVLGYGMYFGFVAAFFWLNVMCIDIWWTMSHCQSMGRNQKRSDTKKKFRRYSVYAWGMSLTFIIVTLVFDKYEWIPILDANIGDGYCWFGSAINTEEDWPHYVFFVMPLGVLSIVNFILWVVTVVHCARVKSAINKMQAGTDSDGAKRRFHVLKDNFILTGKLGVLMGVTWIMELISTLLTNPNGSVPWFIFIIDKINELQGLWIFIMLAFNPVKVYNFLKNNQWLRRLFKQSRTKDLTTPETSMDSMSAGRNPSSESKEE